MKIRPSWMPPREVLLGFVSHADASPGTWVPEEQADLLEEEFEQVVAKALAEQETAENPDRLTLPVTSCARCGKNHDRVDFDRFTEPIRHGGELVATHHGICPKTLQPILMLLTQVGEPGCAEDAVPGGAA